jgi:hypothetical protein
MPSFKLENEFLTVNNDQRRKSIQTIESYGCIFVKDFVVVLRLPWFILFNFVEADFVNNLMNDAEFSVFSW